MVGLTQRLGQTQHHITTKNNLTMPLSPFHVRTGVRNAEPLHNTSMPVIPNSGTHIHVVSEIASFL
jgi:hypothetical protein